MRVKPSPGLKVRDPQSKQPIPADGIEVSETDPFWTRRLADGDVVRVMLDPVATATKQAAYKSKE